MTIEPNPLLVAKMSRLALGFLATTSDPSLTAPGALVNTRPPPGGGIVPRVSEAPSPWCDPEYNP